MIRNNPSLKAIAVLLSAVIILSCGKTKDEVQQKPSDDIPFQLVKAFPHDVNAFTQGLVVENGQLYESTGQAGSWISEVNIVTGEQTKKVILDDRYFGEGITILNGKIYQLTWQSHVGFVYDLKTYKKLKEFTYPYEGWGITHNGTHLIVSDGTHKLHFLDTTTLKQDHEIAVTYKNAPMSNLNELEFVNGFVYANQWQTNYILKIDPSNGKVVGRMDLSSLDREIAKFNGNFDVLNGIAYEKQSRSFLITGKNWPVMFALRIKE